MSDADGSSFSFVHAADLHLDTPFKGVHAVAPFVAEALREASLAAFDSIVQLALERRAAFIVVAGDVYDGADRGIRAQLRFRDGLARLADAGTPSFVVHGNHDPVTTGWSAVRSWPDGVTIFGSQDVEVVPVLRGGEQLATVQGISYARRETTENLALRYGRPVGQSFHVGVLHCNVQGAGQGHGEYSPCTIADLRRAGLDYWALGHVHQHRILSESHGPGDPHIVYAGNSQARSPRPSERGPKGAVVVHVATGRTERIEPVACDKVRFDEIECPVDAIGSLDALEEQLVGRADDALARADGRSLVLRARLVGAGPVHRDLVREGTVDGLLRHLRDAAGAPAVFCWWDALEDATTAQHDLGAVRERGDFSADLLELAEELAKDPGAAAVLAGDLIAAVPRVLRRDASRIVGDELRFRELLAAATTVALDELAGGHG
jgi:DNA repair exonuclease SbcCD nuclease subunit